MPPHLGVGVDFDGSGAAGGKHPEGVDRGGVILADAFLFSVEAHTWGLGFRD